MSKDNSYNSFDLSDFKLVAAPEASSRRLVGSNPRCNTAAASSLVCGQLTKMCVDGKGQREEAETIQPLTSSLLVSGSASAFWPVRLAAMAH
jgi:hypothetical protein